MKALSWPWWLVLNFLLLQWLFLRIDRLYLQRANEEPKHLCWVLNRWVLPFSGWWTRPLYFPYDVYWREYEKKRKKKEKDDWYYRRQWH